MKTLIVTAADSNFFPLLHGLLSSLHRRGTLPYDIAVFDVGLRAGERGWVAPRTRHIVKPGWDLPVAQDVRETKPWLRALTVRPFLPDHFPGYEVYVWLDSDTWLQDRDALHAFVAAAAEGGLAAVAHRHPSYRASPKTLAWRRESLRTYFGEEAVEAAAPNSYLNCGVVALPAGAPHWAAWRRSFASGIARTAGRTVCDQTALNRAVWSERLPLTLLPATCNWLCHLALPEYDSERRLFCEPGGQRTPIGILHLAADTRNRFVKATDGTAVRLRYPARIAV